MALKTQLEFDIAYKRYEALQARRKAFKEECDYHLARLENESLLLLEKMEDWQEKTLKGKGVS